jgi:hypothetical protein
MLVKKLLDAFPSLKPEGHTSYSSLLKKLGIQHEIKYEQPPTPAITASVEQPKELKEPITGSV